MDDATSHTQQNKRVCFAHAVSERRKSENSKRTLQDELNRQNDEFANILDSLRRNTKYRYKF